MKAAAQCCKAEGKQVNVRPREDGQPPSSLEFCECLVLRADGNRGARRHWPRSAPGSLSTGHPVNAFHGEREGKEVPSLDYCWLRSDMTKALAGDVKFP